MTDLATRYLGLDLRNPVVAPASPPSATADGAPGGWPMLSAVVRPSLFEEQVRQQAARDAVVTDTGPTASRRAGSRGGR